MNFPEDDFQAMSDVELGQRIREVRKKRKLTLKNVSERSGVSIATLSKIENGQAMGNFNTLYKIARGLGVLVVSLIAPEEAAASNGSLMTTNKLGTADRHNTNFYDYFVHGSAIATKKMVPLIMQINTTEPPPLKDWSIHDGEEFIYVMEGAIEFHSEIYAAVALEAGESIYFDSGMRHAFVRTSSSTATIISVALSAP